MAFVRSLTAPAAESGIEGDVVAGKSFFWGDGHCGDCHMIHGRGGVMGPDLSTIGRQRTLGEIERELSIPGGTSGYQLVSVRLSNGRWIRGFARNETNYDLQHQDLNGHLYFLRHDEISEIVRETKPLMPPLRENPDDRRNLLAYLISPAGSEARPNPIAPISETSAPGDWPTYYGQPSGNRHSPLRQITVENVGHLAPRWMFSVPDSRHLEVTPVVVDGVMYVTIGNEAFALDARNGRGIWHYQHPRTQGVIGIAAGRINRGVAVFGDRVFLVTNHAHLIALNRITGGLVWDVEMADYRQGYGATAAPLVVKDLVISGVSGDDEGGTNWMSAAWNPETGLFYVMALEKCSVYTKSSARWEPGKSFFGGETREVPGEPGKKYLRAIDIQTGKRVWEYPQIGPADSWSGLLSTAGGLVFFCDDSGAFAALDAKAGNRSGTFTLTNSGKPRP